MFLSALTNMVATNIHGWLAMISLLIEAAGNDGGGAGAHLGGRSCACILSCVAVVLKYAASRPSIQAFVLANGNTVGGRWRLPLLLLKLPLIDARSPPFSSVSCVLQVPQILTVLMNLIAEYKGSAANALFNYQALDADDEDDDDEDEDYDG